MTSQQPAALAKKQKKTLESFVWIPPRRKSGGPTAKSISVRLSTAGGGATATEQSLSLTAMHSFQYFFVVLSKGSRFDYLNKRLDSIRLHRPARRPAKRRSSTKS